MSEIGFDQLMSDDTVKSWRDGKQLASTPQALSIGSSFWFIRTPRLLRIVELGAHVTLYIVVDDEVQRRLQRKAHAIR